MRAVFLLAFLLGTPFCFGQGTPASEDDPAGAEATVSLEETSDEEGSADASDSPAPVVDSDDEIDRLAEAVLPLSGGLKLTFILLMFTNAVICGRWALETGRNFLGWYLFGLFTGPLAGGFLLHRIATDKAGGQAPSGCLAVIVGLGIPLAGWIVWLMILA